MSHHPNNYYTNKTKPYTVTAGDLDTTINYVNTQAAAVRSVSLGGTGISSYVAGDIVYASGATTLAKLSIGTAGSIITTDGTSPSWLAIGDAGTFLTSDGSATSWDYLDKMSFTARADVDIEKGEVVYITGISGNTATVDLAQANNASTMPAFGLAAASVTATNNVEIVTFGSLRGLTDTDFKEGSLTLAIGDTVYVSSATAGKLTNVPPTGETNLIQNIGRIERATPTSNMTIKVGGAGRSAITPALNNGNIFIGDSNNESSIASLTTKIEDYLDGATSTPIFSDVTVDSVTISTIQTSVESFVDNDTSLMTSAAIDDRINSAVSAEDTLAEMNDVNIGSLSDGDILNYNGGLWYNGQTFSGQYAFTNSSGTTLDITNHAGFEIDFTGGTTTNIRSERDMHLLAQAGYEINLGSNNTSGVLVVASDGDVDMSGGLNVTNTATVGTLSVGTGNTNLVSLNPVSSGNTSSTADLGANASVAYNQDNGTVYYGDAYTLLSVPANQIGVIKDDVTVDISISNALFVNTNVQTSYSGTAYLQVNNGSGWATADTTGYSNANTTPSLTWDVSVFGRFSSDDFGDDIQIRVGINLSSNTATSGGVTCDADISNGAAYARYARIVSYSDTSTLLNA